MSSMVQIKQADEMQAWALARRLDGARIGLVPTMGICMQDTSRWSPRRASASMLSVSIFVNPVQFPQRGL